MLLALGAIVELETGVGATVVFEAEGATVVVFEAEGDREVITSISARLDATRQPIMMIRIFIFAKVANDISIATFLHNRWGHNGRV